MLNRGLISLVFLFVGISVHGASNNTNTSFPGNISLSRLTNRIGDNGVGITYNGTLISSSSANWTASGTSNSLLAGTALLNNIVVTNGISSGGTGLSVFTNGISFPVTTTWSALNSGSNYAADLSLPVVHFNMTTNLNILHATNGTANFTANFAVGNSIKIINNSGTNFPVSWNSNWKTYGTWASGFTLTNGDWCLLSVRFAGPSTSQTNVDVAVAYKQF